MAEKGQKQWLRQKHNFYCSPEMSNKVAFQRKGSSVALKFLLDALKGKQCCLFMTALSNFLKKVVKISKQSQNHFFENVLCLDITGEQEKCCF